MRIVLVSCLAALLAAGSAASTGALSASPADAPEICGAIDAGLEQTLKQTDLLLLGEIHGSAEVPEFSLEAVCAALRLPGPVILGLEIPVAEQARIDRYLRSSGDLAAREALLAGPFWRSERPDGRSSRAMLELINAARRLIQAGQRLSVVCFDAPPSEPGISRDQAMARALLKLRDRSAEARIIVLTGNLHARTRGSSRFTPMGAYLRAARPSVIALNIRRAPGSFWLCNPGCGVKELGGSGEADDRGVTLFPVPDEFGYDGVFDIGAPTASPPAVP